MAKILRYNPLVRLLRGNVFLTLAYCVLDIHKTAVLAVNGVFRFGVKRIRGSRLETRLLLERGAALETDGAVSIGYGACIEVLRGGRLKFGGRNITNTNLTIICGESIEIGRHVSIGRNVTIRDTNGNHL